MKRTTMILVIAASFAISAKGQGFLNLNFESAHNLPGNPGNGELVSVANALPDWTAYGGPVYSGNVLSDVYYASNIVYGAAASVALESGSLALSGNYSAELFLNSAISQTGLVPDSAESLEFEAEGQGSDGSIAGSNLSVTLGGQSLSYSEISQDSGYNVYGANIPSDLDDETEALIFSCQGAGSGQVELDDIEFSTSPIPEPGEFALGSLGAILLGIRHWRELRK